MCLHLFIPHSIPLLSTQAKILEHDNVNYLKKILGELGMVLDQIEAELEKRKLEYQGRHWGAFVCFSTRGQSATPETVKSFVHDEQLPWSNHEWDWGCHWALLVLGTLTMILLTSGKPCLHPLPQGTARPLSSWVPFGSPKPSQGDGRCLLPQQGVDIS